MVTFATLRSAYCPPVPENSGGPGSSPRPGGGFGWCGGPIRLARQYTGPQRRLEALFELCGGGLPGTASAAAHRSEGHERKRLQLRSDPKTAARSPWSDFRSALRGAAPVSLRSTTGDQNPGGEGADRTAEPAPGFSDTWCSRPAAVISSPGDHLAKLDLPLWPDGQREDQPRGTDAARLPGRDPGFPTPWRWTGRLSSSTIRWPTKPFKTRTRTSTRAGCCAGGRGPACGGGRADAQHVGAAPGRGDLASMPRRPKR